MLAFSLSLVALFSQANTEPIRYVFEELSLQQQLGDDPTDLPAVTVALESSTCANIDNSRDSYSLGSVCPAGQVLANQQDLNTNTAFPFHSTFCCGYDAGVTAALSNQETVQLNDGESVLCPDNKVSISHCVDWGGDSTPCGGTTSSIECAELTIDGKATCPVDCQWYTSGQYFVSITLPADVVAYGWCWDVAGGDRCDSSSGTGIYGCKTAFVDPSS